MKTIHITIYVIRLKFVFTGEDKEEFSLLLKEITTLDRSNPNLYPKKKNNPYYFGQNLFL